MNKFLVLIAMMVYLVITSCNGNKSASELNPKEFKEAISQHKDAIILDVRTPEEFAKMHLENAINIDFNNPEFENQITSLAKDKKIYIYCQGGSRSAGAAIKMKELGYSDIQELKGGIVAWNSYFNEAKPTSESTTANKGEMMMADFEALINTDKTVLVDFYAEWCGPCQKMKPFLHEIAQENQQVKLVQIDVDKNPQIAALFKIEALPTLMIYKNKTKVWHHLGYMDKTDLLKQLAL